MAALRTTAHLAALCRRATRWSQQVTKLSFSTKVCSQHPFMNLKTMFRNSVFLLLNSQMIISFLLNVILANSSAILKQTRYLREGTFWLIDQSKREPDFESCFQISQLSKKYYLSSDLYSIYRSVCLLGCRNKYLIICISSLFNCTNFGIFMRCNSTYDFSKCCTAGWFFFLQSLKNYII